MIRANGPRREGTGRTEESSQEESLDLDPLPSKLLDREDGSIVACLVYEREVVLLSGKYGIGSTRGIRTRNEPESSNDHVSSRDTEELIPWCSSLSIEPNLLKDDVLVQVDAVEPDDEHTVSADTLRNVRASKQEKNHSRNIQKEPSHTRPNQHLQILPLREVVDKVLEMRLLLRERFGSKARLVRTVISFVLRRRLC